MSGATTGPQAGAGVVRAFVFERIDPTEKSLDWLRERGLELTLGRAMWDVPFRSYAEDEIIAQAQGFEAVMGASGAHFTRRVIDALPHLRFISKFGIGYDSIDIAAATARGILVTNTPDKLDALAVCEHTIACILALKKQLLTWTPDYMRAGGWRAGDFSGFLNGTTLGIVGLGQIGRGVAERLAGWNVRIIAHDPYVTAAPPGVELTDLDRLLAEADTVTLHATPNAENKHMIDAERLARMKRGSLLVNAGRASLVDYGALRDALASGQLGGAALDVFEEEPPDVADPLFTMKNVLVTPHTAAWTYDGVQSLGWHGAKNLWAMLSGDGHADIVNPEARDAGLPHPNSAARAFGPPT